MSRQIKTTGILWCNRRVIFSITKNLNTNNATMQAYNKTCQAHAESMQALQNETLAALADTTSSQRQNSFLDERAALLTPTRDPPVTLKDDRGQIFALDNGMIDIWLLMGKQTIRINIS